MADSSRSAIPLLICNYRIRFDFNEHARVDQSANLYHGRRGHDVAESLFVCTPDFLPLIDVGHEHAGAHNVR